MPDRQELRQEFAELKQELEALANEPDSPQKQQQQRAVFAQVREVVDEYHNPLDEDPPRR